VAFTIELEQDQDYAFRVKFDHDSVPSLLVDEIEPIGRGRGPNPDRLLAVAAANCLTASLLFCMRKFKQTPSKLRAQVIGRLTRNARGRLRVGSLAVTIQLSDPAARIAHIERCLSQFEDFCVVTESIRHGIPVEVKVIDGDGQVLHQT
jgi:organic hydroperoxide reductase OsmC/OhrA